MKKKKQLLSLSGKRAIAGWLFILPFAIGFVAFIGVSLVMTARMSLSDVSASAGSGILIEWNNFENYRHAFAVHPEFKEDLARSIFSMLIDVPLIIFFSLFMAILLNQKFRGRTVVRAVFFLPVILGAQAISIALADAQATMMGGINSASAEITSSLEGASGVNAQYYLNMLGQIGLPINLINYVVGAVQRINAVIISSGVQIVIFVAALQSIPPTLYEVSKIEGATAYETFWKVTFPMVTPLILTNIVYTIIDQFAKSVIVESSYNVIFSENNFGLGSAFSLISSVLVCLILLVVGLIFSKRTHYAT
jgi:ABC-type sugar transport system permease subunit